MEKKDACGCSVVEGHLIADADTVRTLLLTLQSQMDADDEVRQRFQNEPRAVLGDIGLSRDIQNEVLSERGIDPGAEAGCWATCACTGCCVTN